ncbi:TspO/MBR family protein [Dysgonomonas sp. BGC7]|uniref:TspO/MBR family protein n=1 Tax=Dysgonomonas sp. BGC7 TaxID=1658008 RepID=UPI000681C37E|nr:TspO/MBR family protein [Dysgonomonas sp. BGC7]MBD8387232.1 tryptophan-rich sensory protein [Dysgonomonas sp. BGC7]
MRKFLYIILPIIICFLVRFTASYFQSESIQTWYPTLSKPEITPPNIAFPIAWSIIYLCMGISIGLILNSKEKSKKNLTLLFVIQLFFNFTWSISFFYLQNPLLGFINIILLDIAVLYYAFKCYPTQKMSGVLFVPYILWLILATYLNAYILIYN